MSITHISSISTVAKRITVHQQQSIKWEARIIINGQLTTAGCLHNHQSEGYAQKCCKKQQARWDAIAACEHSVSLVPMYDGLYEVRWLEPAQPTLTSKRTLREVWTRFYITR